MNIKKETQLKTFMEKLAREALENASKDILDIFQKEYLMGYAYIDSPKQYSRTLEFYRAWSFTDIKKSLNSLLTELWYNPDEMKTFDPDRYIHGSKYSTPPDSRDNLPAILEGKRSSLWLSVERKGKFFQEFLNEMFGRGELERILTKRFSEKGFVRI